MEVISPKIINFYLRPYLDSLLGEEIVSLRETLLDSDRVEDLPAELRENLHLKEYLLTRNLVKIILDEFNKLISERCKPAKLINTDQREQIREFIQEKLEASLESWKLEKTSADEGEQLEQDDESSKDEMSPELLEYSNFLLEKILDDWRCDVKVTPKLSKEDGWITLLIQHPVLRLSECREMIEKWSDILQSNLKEVHFVAKEIFYIDCSLSKDKWHGKGILVYSKRIKCLPGSYTWDISGKADGESGGHFLGICKDYRGLENLKIICNVGHETMGQVAGRNQSGMTLTKVMSLFPPSANSDTLRKLVFENAMSFEGQKNSILYEPKDAYDSDARKVTGQISDFYMEGETENGCKYFIGFRKGIFTKNAFCFFQSNDDTPAETNEHAGKPGTVTMVSLESPNSTLPLEEVGIQLVAESNKRAGWVMVNGVSGNDVGYLSLNAKQTVEYPAGRYELKMEDEEKPGSINCKLMGKYLRICERETIGNDKRISKSGSISQDVNQNSIFQNPSLAFELYKDQVGAFADDKVMEELLTTYELKWWTDKIFSLQSDE